MYYTVKKLLIKNIFKAIAKTDLGSLAINSPSEPENEQKRRIQTCGLFLLNISMSLKLN
jgi:hypothetical protein